VSTVTRSFDSQEDAIEFVGQLGIDFLFDWPDDPEAEELARAMYSYGFIGRFDFDPEGHMAEILGQFGINRLLFGDEIGRAFMEGVRDGWWSNEKYEAGEAVLDAWKSATGTNRREIGEAMLQLFRDAGYVTDSPSCVFTEPTAVYRGNLGEDPRRGFSWTLDRDKAAWFSTYSLSPGGHVLRLVRADDDVPQPTVWTATVQPEAILAYFTSYEEDEVIVDPGKLTEFEIDHWPEVHDASNKTATDSTSAVAGRDPRRDNRDQRPRSANTIFASPSEHTIGKEGSE